MVVCTIYILLPFLFHARVATALVAMPVAVNNDHKSSLFFLPSPLSSSIRISSTSLVKRTSITSVISTISTVPRINNNNNRVMTGRKRHHLLFLTPNHDGHDDHGTSPALAGEQQQQQEQLVFKERTESEWKKLLTPQQYYVLREEGTERPWTSPLNTVKQDGVFLCAGCGSPLFTASKKFESGTGWPSFYDPLDADSIELSVDYKLIVPRVEVSCKTCGGHLGHVFEDGPRPTGKRYCINGVAMEFVEYAKDPDMAKIVSVREQQGSKYNNDMAGKKNKASSIREPFMAVAPGLALDLIVAGLFLNVFFSQASNDLFLLDALGGQGGSGGTSVRVDQIVFQSVPLGIGIFYLVQALFKLKRLLP